MALGFRAPELSESKVSVTRSCTDGCLPLPGTMSMWKERHGLQESRGSRDALKKANRLATSSVLIILASLRKHVAYNPDSCLAQPRLCDTICLERSCSVSLGLAASKQDRSFTRAWFLTPRICSFSLASINKPSTLTYSLCRLIEQHVKHPVKKFLHQLPTVFRIGCCSENLKEAAPEHRLHQLLKLNHM